MINFNGKTFLVTGATGLLGGAVVDMLEEAGAAEIICTRFTNSVGARRLNEKQVVSRVYTLDITNPHQMEQFAGEFGLVDGIAHCAGINVPGGLKQISDSDAKTVLDVNLYGSFLVGKYLCSNVIDFGSMVFVGSSSANTGGPTSVHYAASKSGMEGLVKGVARVVAPRDVRVNLIHPGYIRGEMGDEGMKNPAVQKMLGNVLLNRMCNVKEVAGVICFLLSDLSSYMTGQIINADGGMI